MAYTEYSVTSDAAGGGDGSLGSPFTWAEMFSNMGPGISMNVKSGTYNVAGGSCIAGSVAQACRIRPYKTVYGDLEDQFRNEDGSLDTTDLPVINLSSAITPVNYVIFIGLNISCSLSTGAIYSTTADGYAVIKCKIVNNGSGYGLRGDNNCFFLYNDIEETSTSHNIVIDADRYITAIGNRIKGNTSGGVLLECDDGVVEDNYFIGPDDSIGLYMKTTSAQRHIKNNTFYNLGTDIQFISAVSIFVPTIINNHCTDSAKYLDNLYSATANAYMLEIHNRTRDNTTPRTGIGDGININEVTTDTGGPSTDYTDVTNGDLSLISSAPGIDAGIGFEN